MGREDSVTRFEWLNDYIAHAMLSISSSVVVTLHGGNFHTDKNGFVDETEDIPEIARIEMENFFTGTTIRFENLPECDAKHVAVWTPRDHRLLLRAYCFPIEDHSEWAQTRHIPAGGSVTVNIQ